MEEHTENQGQETTPVKMDLGLMRRVSEISLLIGSIATVGILMIALYVDAPYKDYLQSISGLLTTSRNLGPVMLLSGFCLVGACTTVTWLIALYNSLHVAGPLYRFSRNLQLDDDGNPVPMIRIRSTDYLQGEFNLLKDTLQDFNGHYRRIDAQLKALRTAIEDGDEEKARLIYSELQASIRDVKLDD